MIYESLRMQKILVTGGLGYIGSHTVVGLIEAGFGVVILDNLSNAEKITLDRMAQITGHTPIFFEGDIRDTDLLSEICLKHADINAVIHFAGLKAVGESVAHPLKYYDNNVVGALRLLEAMQKHHIKNIIFSSSATVYAPSHGKALCEDDPKEASNPYGHTKSMIEDILQDQFASDPSWRISILRYFNPVGAHASGLIGENPRGIPNNLFPYIAQVASGLRAHLNVFGGDYPTPDGTAVRDYIHIHDLVAGHIASLKYSFNHEGLHIFNLGTGKGTSVLEALKTFELTNQIKIPYEITKRREGDIAICFANADLAYNVLGWKAEKTLRDMCQDHWRWQQHLNQCRSH
jgi:UDP-glucose 4-epimerase